MRFYEEQQFNMLTSVSGFLRERKNKFAEKVPALGDFIHEFVAKYDALVHLMSGKKYIVSVRTSQKKTIKEGLVDTLMILSGILYAHYYNDGNKKELDEEESNNSKFKANFDYSESELKRMSAKKLCEVSSDVITAAKKIKHLNRYGINPGDIKDAETYYEEFLASKDKPKQGKKEAANRNGQVSREIKECISMLDNKIDRLLRLAVKDELNLDDEYKNRRKVIGKGNGRPSDKEVRYRISRKKKTLVSNSPQGAVVFD